VECPKDGEPTAGSATASLTVDADTERDDTRRNPNLTNDELLIVIEQQ